MTAGIDWGGSVQPFARGCKALAVTKSTFQREQKYSLPVHHTSTGTTQPASQHCEATALQWRKGVRALDSGRRRRCRWTGTVACMHAGTPGGIGEGSAKGVLPVRGGRPSQKGGREGGGHAIHSLNSLAADPQSRRAKPTPHAHMYIYHHFVATAALIWLMASHTHWCGAEALKLISDPSLEPPLLLNPPPAC